MKIRSLLVAGIACLAINMNVMAAFTQPTDAQIQAAAVNPAQLSALLRGASLEQAAHVVKSVVARMVGLRLSNDVLITRVTEVITAALAAIPDNGYVAFATMMGNEMGSSEAIRSSLAVVSAVQGALATHSAATGTGEPAAFARAYLAAVSGSGSLQNTKTADKVQAPDPNLDKVQTPEPKLAKFYEGQN